VIWVLRKESAGWRVVGMITRPFADKDPVVFNYEDIPSLVAAKNFIEEESTRREAEEERQAAQKKSDGDHPAAKPLTASTAGQATDAKPNDPAVANRQPAKNDSTPREAMKPQPPGATSQK